MDTVDYPIPLTRAQDSFAAYPARAPITEARRVTVNGDRLRAGAEDLRLFGVNIGPSDLDHRGAFQFLASLGVNAIRVNLPFRVWGPDGEPARPGVAPLELPRAVLDRLCKQQQLCEEEGIYILLRDLALGLGEPYYSAEDAAAFGIGNTRDSCVLGLWHPGVRTLVMERLKRLMQHENPYTKRPFGASPALLGIQLTNEVGWFLAEPQRENGLVASRLRRATARTRERLSEALGIEGDMLRLDPRERVMRLAASNKEAHTEARDLLRSLLGSKRPLLVADSAPMAGPAAFEAFQPCDAYGWNVYPAFGDPGEVNGPILPYDLSREPILDRLQVRLGDKPTLITEVGAKLAPGGFSRLIADVTVRCARFGYAGLFFHEMYRPLFGPDSRLPRFLESRAPQYNFDMSTDPGALVALQACAPIFRRGLIPLAPRTFRIRDTARSLVGVVVSRGRRLEDIHELAYDLEPEFKTLLGSLEVMVLLQPSDRSDRSGGSGGSDGCVQPRHVRCGDVEIEWETYPQDPERDSLLIRVPWGNGRWLIVAVGRSMPTPAEQTFRAGMARLTGLRKYTWPDPRTGYGEKQVVRRPVGPDTRIRGRLYFVEPSGSRGREVEVTDPTSFYLPTSGVRFMDIETSTEAASWRGSAPSGR
jgi:hypothetical protein